jgi:hypothetical protein
MLLLPGGVVRIGLQGWGPVLPGINIARYGINRLHDGSVVMKMTKRQ